MRRLVLNDVGPVIEWKALARIGEYVGQMEQFDSLPQAADALWEISGGHFGPHTRQQWLDLCAPQLRPRPQGGLTLHYDPAIAVPFQALAQATPEMAQAGEAALWELYDRITAQTLLLRGAESDLLSLATATAMTQRGPQARLVEFDQVGHAPTLVVEQQIAVVRDFLLQANEPR